VRDEHQLQVAVLAPQALDRPEKERLGDLPLALAHAARDVEQQDHDCLHRRLLAFGELPIAQIVVGEGGRVLAARSLHAAPLDGLFQRAPPIEA
jgi:hypothetical protein